MDTILGHLARNGRNGVLGATNPDSTRHKNPPSVSMKFDASHNERKGMNGTNSPKSTQKRGHRPKMPSSAYRNTGNFATALNKPFSVRSNSNSGDSRLEQANGGGNRAELNNSLRRPPSNSLLMGELMVNNQLGQKKRDLSVLSHRPRELSTTRPPVSLTGGNHILYDASFRPHYYGLADFIEQGGDK